MASLKHNIIANYIGRAWTSILGLLFIPLYLRHLGIEAYGLVGFYTALSSVLGIFDLGIGATMNRELARLSAREGATEEQRNIVRTLEVIYWGIAILAGGIVIFLAPFISHTWIKAQDISSATILRSVQLMGIAAALQFPMSLYQGGLMGLHRQILVNVILIITGSIRAVGAMLVVWLLSPTIQAFLAWQVVASVIGSLGFFFAMWWALPKYKRPARFRVNTLSGVWKYAAAISVNAIIGVVLTQLDKVVLSKFLTLKTFGYYSIASTVASAMWMIIVPFNTSTFPYFVQLYAANNLVKLKQLIAISSQFIAVLLLPITLILAVYSKEILLIWTGDQDVSSNAFLLVSLLVAGTALNGLASIPANAATAIGWPQLVMVTNLCQAIVIVPVMILLVKAFGALGAAISYVILNSVFLFVMTPFFFRRYAVFGNYFEWLKTSILSVLLPLMLATSFFNFIMVAQRWTYVPIIYLLSLWAILAIIAILFSKDVRVLILNLKLNNATKPDSLWTK
jgi:O-antigen/teichoic acid export membrane protein